MMDSSSEQKHVNPATLPDVYVRCPYFPEHELRRSRLPYHLLKCQRNPHAPKLLACPYNYLHRVRSEDRAEHLITCEDKPKTKYNDRDLPSYANTVKASASNKGIQKLVIDEEPQNELEEWW